MKTRFFFITTLTILSIVFLWFVYADNAFYSSGIRAAIMVMFLVFYFGQVKVKNKYFFLFLILFATAQALDFLGYFIRPGLSFGVDYFYYIGNSLNILAYTSLIIKVLKSMNIKDVLIKLPAHFVILVVLDIFCVTIVTETARTELSIYQYSLEFLYNAVIMSLLTLAVINYIYKVDKKAMNLLIASIFIVFSEMIQLAYFYVSENNRLLNIFCSLFLILAFLFLFLQAGILESDESNTFKEHIEA